MEVEVEEGTGVAAAVEGATRGIDATGAKLPGEASETTTQMPKDFSKCTNGSHSFLTTHSVPI